jgi:hypothetical protein
MAHGPWVSSFYVDLPLLTNDLIYQPQRRMITSAIGGDEQFGENQVVGIQERVKCKKSLRKRKSKFFHVAARMRRREPYNRGRLCCTMAQSYDMDELSKLRLIWRRYLRNDLCN